MFERGNTFSEAQVSANRDKNWNKKKYKKGHGGGAVERTGGPEGPEPPAHWKLECLV